MHVVIDCNHTFWKILAAPPQSAGVEAHPSAQWFLQTLWIISLVMSILKFLKMHQKDHKSAATQGFAL